MPGAEGPRKAGSLPWGVAEIERETDGDHLT